MRRLSLLVASVWVAFSLGAIPGVAAPHDHEGHDHGTEATHEHAHHDHDGHDHAHEGHDHEGHHHDVSASEETLLGEDAPKVTITEGHIDLGPRLVDGQWVLAARDDTAKTPVWRQTNDMAFVLGENTVLPVPESADYQFLGVPAGTRVYTIGQNQVSGAPWLGWNTQAPELAQAGVSGVKLRLTGHQGPGEVHVFLQAGNFGAPQVVWSTAGHKSTEIYIEANTHTHANWVFTQPGVHLLQFQVTGADGDGRQISATAVLRFAVGKDVTPEQALGAKWQDSSSFEGATHANASDSAQAGDSEHSNAAGTAAASATGGAQGEAGEPRQNQSEMGWWLPLVGGMLVVLIPAGAIVVVRRRAREREAVEHRYVTETGAARGEPVNKSAGDSTDVASGTGNATEGNHD